SPHRYYPRRRVQGSRRVNPAGGRGSGQEHREELRMGPDEAVRLRAVLDRMVKEKAIAAAFFGRMAESLEEVDQRRSFRRMAQDEKDQRKILVKHHRELCGQVPTTLPIVVSAIHERLTKIGRGE